MILVVSALIAVEVSALLDDVIPAPEPESPFSLLDETSEDELEEFAAIHDELLGKTPADELDSLTALLSPLTGAAPFSSLQATNPTTEKISK